MATAAVTSPRTQARPRGSDTLVSVRQSDIEMVEAKYQKYETIITDQRAHIGFLQSVAENMQQKLGVLEAMPRYDMRPNQQTDLDGRHTEFLNAYNHDRQRFAAYVRT